MAPSTDPVACLEQTRAVLAGMRLPLDPAGAKMLHFMVKHREGCDAWLTREWFFVQYGWHLSHHRYYSDVAPVVVSWLLETAGVTGAVEDCTTIVPASTVPAMDRLPSFRHGERALWIRASADRIDLQIRDGVSPAVLASPPSPLEPPIEYVAGAWPCPHCRATPERFRVLRGGGVVCLACGRSSSGPA
jgi:hypothetical protein